MFIMLSPLRMTPVLIFPPIGGWFWSVKLAANDNTIGGNLKTRVMLRGLIMFLCCWFGETMTCQTHLKQFLLWSISRHYICQDHKKSLWTRFLSPSARCQDTTQTNAAMFLRCTSPYAGIELSYDLAMESEINFWFDGQFLEIIRLVKTFFSKNLM